MTTGSRSSLPGTRSRPRPASHTATAIRAACCSFFFQAEDGIRDLTVTGVQTCALPISLDLSGIYQSKNIITVLSAVEELKIRGWNNPDNAVIDALQNVKKLTGLHGRWEVDRKSVV